MVHRTRCAAGLVLALGSVSALESTSRSRLPPTPSAASRAHETPVLDHVPGGGPDGGWIHSLAVTATEPTAVYAAAFDGGVFVSRNRGASWTPADRGLPPDTGCEIVAAPAPVPTLYAACGDGLFKTTNGGTLWIQLDLDNAVLPIVAPSDGRVLYMPPDGYMPPNGRIVRSANGGHHWEQRASSLADSCGSPAMHPSDPLVLFCLGDRIMTSGDGGVSWSPFSKAPADTQVSALALHPSDGNTILVGTTDGRTFRTTDGGSTWQGASSHGDGIGYLQFIGASGDVVVAGIGSTIRRSLDGGRHWDSLTLDVGPVDQVSAIAVDPSAPSTVYAGTRDGVLVTTDFGRSWTRRRAGLSRARVSIALDDEPPLTLRATTGDAAFVSRDQGNTWSSTPGSPRRPEAGTADRLGLASAVATGPAAALLPNGEPAVDLVKSRGATRLAYASSGGLLGWIRGTYGLWRSEDEGVSWQRGSEPRGISTGVGHCCRLLVDPQDDSTAYAVVGGVGIGAYGDLVLRSVDAGRSWHRLPLPGLAVHLSIVTTQPPTLVLQALDADGGGTYASFTSTDRGETWRESVGIPPGVRVNNLVSDPRRPARLFAGTEGRGVFRSFDAGATWHAAGRTP